MNSNFIYLFLGALPLPNTQKAPEALCARMLMVFMGFFIAILAFFRSMACQISGKKLTNGSQHTPEQLSLDKMAMEQNRSPSSIPKFTEAELLSNLTKRLGELEEKVDTLQSKPSQMPYEKEELLNAAVCRVDALEAELIATKKVLCDTLLSFQLWKLELL